MDNRSEVREFLISGRARITPEQAGLSPFGSRRVNGLRRGEVFGANRELPADPGLTVLVYTAEPGSPRSPARSPSSSQSGSRPPERHRRGAPD